MKSKGAAYFLWFIGLCGILGFHRFYLGKYISGLLWMFSFGMGGIGAMIDLFTLGSQVEQYNTKIELQTLRSVATETARMTAHKMAQGN